MSLQYNTSYGTALCFCSLHLFYISQGAELAKYSGYNVQTAAPCCKAIISHYTVYCLHRRLFFSISTSSLVLNSTKTARFSPVFNSASYLYLQI